VDADAPAPGLTLEAELDEPQALAAMARAAATAATAMCRPLGDVIMVLSSVVGVTTPTEGTRPGL
jgi:hypothetical protein